jgi:hypothetical protein
MISEDRELERVLRLLRRDVLATVGPEHDQEVHRLATIALEYLEPTDAADKIVEDVQQYLHDTFVDTTWPTCPRHPHHPLWFRNDAWWCEQEGVPAFRLGELPPRHPERAERS